jgi:O-methyltransferase
MNINFDKDILHHHLNIIKPNKDSFLLSVKNASMLGYERLENLRQICLKYKDLDNITAIECGCARGGSLLIMKKYLNKNAQIYGFDSWEEMPHLTKEDENEQRAIKYNFDMKNNKLVGRKFGSLGVVNNNFKINNLNTDNVNLIKGFFENTLIDANINNINNIAILRLDADFYEATMLCLEKLYHKVMDGGVIIIDDFYAYKGCRKAVMEFRDKHNIKDELYHTKENGLDTLTGGVEVFWYKNSKK